MNIYMIGYDDTLLREDPFVASDTISRMRVLAARLACEAPRAKLVVLLRARSNSRHREYWLAPNVWIVPVPSRRLWHFPWRAFITVMRLARRFRPAVITTQSPFEDALVGLAVRFLFRSAFQVQIHFDFFSPLVDADRPLLRFLRMHTARVVLRCADAVRVVTRAVAKQLVDSLNIREERIVYLPVPVEVEGLRMRTERERMAAIEAFTNIAGVRGLLFVGELSFAKDPLSFVHMAARVADAVPDVIFLMVGSGPLFDNVLELIRSYKLTERVLLLGSLPHEQVVSLLRCSECLVVTSRHEGFCRVIAEAHFVGTPCVATRSAGATELISEGQTGLLVAIGDPEAIAAAVLWILHNPEQADAMAQRARLSIQGKFSRENWSKIMIHAWFDAARRRNKENQNGKA